MDQAGEEQPLRAGSGEMSVGYKLRLAQITAYRGFEERVTGYGSAPRYLGLLMIIDANPGQPQSRLAEAVAVRRSSLVAILDTLEREGVVERRPSETDRRSKAVALTAKGRGVLADLLEAADAHEAALTAGLTEEERATLLSALDRVIANMRAAEGDALPPLATGAASAGRGAADS
ncbi:MarR family transcriptional regulator [Aquicoccus sp. SCR17]|nr:MarR family transcriptional regulator [Carideicomes alvinocaridis]